MEVMLNMKAWKIFCLIFLIPILSLFFLVPTDDVDLVFIAFPVILLFSTLVMLFWMWCVGIGLNNYISSSISPSLTIFKVCIIYTAVYIPIYQVLFISISITETFQNLMSVILPFHFAAMLCTFYIMYFIAKILCMAEEGREVKFSDYKEILFLFWFYPIGIWSLQPRINKVFQKNT